MSKPFNGPEFLALFRKWNKILEQDGLKEIEDFSLPEPALKAWHNLKWQEVDTDKIEETTRYYELASELLHTYAFKNDFQRFVWALHCEGLSVRKIAAKISLRKFTKSTVNNIIIEIKKKSGLGNG